MLRASGGAKGKFPCASEFGACSWRWCRSRRPPTRILSACRMSRRRISSSSTSIRWNTSSRTRCARSPTRSRGSAGCSIGRLPSRPSILLKDLADYGNVAQQSAPHSRLFVDIAPLSHAFETFPASERMYSLMNHEMVHVGDRRHRVRGRTALAPHLPGQGLAAAAESGIAALQLPDDPALHGAALVHRGRRSLHGDLDGGRPGPRAGRL